MRFYSGKVRMLSWYEVFATIVCNSKFECLFPNRGDDLLRMN